MPTTEKRRTGILSAYVRPPLATVNTFVVEYKPEKTDDDEGSWIGSQNYFLGYISPIGITSAGRKFYSPDKGGTVQNNMMNKYGDVIGTLEPTTRTEVLDFGETLFKDEPPGFEMPWLYIGLASAVPAIAIGMYLFRKKTRGKWDRLKRGKGKGEGKGKKKQKAEKKPEPEEKAEANEKEKK